MSKFIFADVKVLKRRYKLICLFVSLFFLMISVSIVIFIKINPLKMSQKYISENIEPLFKISVVVFIMAIIIMMVIRHVFIKAHRKNTFIDITQSHVIFSVLEEIRYLSLKPTYYKVLYVIKLSEITKIDFEDNLFKIKAEVKIFREEASHLLYSATTSKISFDNWWFDLNPTSECDHIELDCFYANPRRIVRIIRNYSAVAKSKEQKRREYHESLLKLASLPPKTKTRRQQIIEKKNRELNNPLIKK